MPLTAVDARPSRVKYEHGAKADSLQAKRIQSPDQDMREATEAVCSITNMQFYTIALIETIFRPIIGIHMLIIA